MKRSRIPKPFVISAISSADLLRRIRVYLDQRKFTGSERLAHFRELKRLARAKGYQV